jgi:hypothetical protein
MVSHIVFGLFFALTIVCAVRGIVLQVQTMIKLEEPVNIVPASATAVEV